MQVMNFVLYRTVAVQIYKFKIIEGPFWDPGVTFRECLFFEYLFCRFTQNVRIFSVSNLFYKCPFSELR
jgi:hypothetical protein